VTKEGPNGRCLKDQTPKPKSRPFGAKGGLKIHKITRRATWRENLISLIMLLMLSHAMLKK